MDQLVPLVSQKLGIDESTSRQALGALLRFLKEQAAKTDYDFDDQILAKLDGSSKVVEETAKDLPTEEEEQQTSTKSGSSSSSNNSSGGGGKSSPSGLLGIVWSLLKVFGVLALLKQLLEPLFGDYAIKLIDGVEDGAELAGIFSSLGIDREQGVTIAQTVLNFLKEKLDPATIDSLLEQIPALKLIMSDSKKEE